MADDTTEPFVWGSGGERLSAGSIAAKRRIAEALMAQGGDYSPVRSWTQGLARVATSLNGALQSREADRAEAANEARTQALLLSNPALGGSAAPTATAAPAASPGVARVASALAAGPNTVVTPDGQNTVQILPGSTEDPIQSAGPMEAPSGQDRINMVATALGEQPAGSAAGLGALNTIRNRAIDGGYGGNTPTAVVTAPKQYSSMNDPANRAALLARATANTPEVAKVSDAIDQTYGVGKYVAAGPNDPTEGKTHFYDPGSMVPPNAVPTWAQGKEYQTIGSTRFYDDPDQPAPSGTGRTRIATALAATPADAALPAGATPTQGYAVPGQPAAPNGMPQIPPAQIGYIKQLLLNPDTRAAGAAMLAQYKPQVGAPYKDADGNLVQRAADGTVHVLSAADKAPGSIKEFEYGQTHPDFVTQQLAKTKAGAATLNNANNIDMNSGQTYDKQLAEGLGKSHAALANGVEDAQSRARDLAAMQGAVDAIQRNGGTTGGLGQQQALDIKKSINAGANALGIDTPFNENDLSDKEFLTKFNRQIAGAQAKGAMGARVTNFEMGNYLKANPGLDMSITGNQRLLGIQSQIEQRNVAVGNAIRAATAAAISADRKIDPVTVQGIITEYDAAHHVQDPITGQDLTQSYALPEFQQPGQGANSSLAIGHETNINGIKIKRVN